MQSDSKQGCWLVLGAVVLLSVVLGMAAWWFEGRDVAEQRERLQEQLAIPTRTVAEQHCVDQGEQIFGPQIDEMEFSVKETLQNPYLSEAARDRILATFGTAIEKVVEAQVSFIQACWEKLPPSEAR